MAHGSVLLEGAPDALIGTSEAKTSAVQVMHLEMSNEIIDDLLECIRKGKTPQVLFGKTPLLRYDGKSHELHSRPEKFRHELYRENQENEDGAWKFSGLVNHNLAIRDAEVASAGMDRALETLKNNMASIEQEHQARKAAITPESRPMKGPSKAQSRANLLKPLLANRRSSPSSPALGSSTPSQVRPPTSAGLDMPHDVAIKKALVHYLAVQARPYSECRATVHANPRQILERIAKQTGKGEDEWMLLDRAYKELDVFKFKYSEEDRDTVVQNAIHAYDRMRLSKDDPLWDKLLSPAQRGQGKILSRLHLKDTSKGTPAMKPQTFDKKTGLPKRKEPKKAERAEKVEKQSTKMKKAGQEEKPKAMKSAAESSTPKVQPRKKTVPVKRNERVEDGPAQSRMKEVKPSAAAKSLLNKPKNLSPLGASPPVNASDFENGHPVHKRLSAATSPRRAGTKRKADEINGVSYQVNGVTKRPHIDSSGSSSEDHPLKARPSAPSNGINGTSAHGRGSPDSDSSASSQPLALSWRQSLEMARKFNMYYQRYKKLYNELSQSKEPPSEKKREELLGMHRRLERMKREVNEGVL